MPAWACPGCCAPPRLYGWSPTMLALHCTARGGLACPARPRLAARRPALARRALVVHKGRVSSSPRSATPHWPSPCPTPCSPVPSRWPAGRHWRLRRCRRPWWPGSCWRWWPAGRRCPCAGTLGAPGAVAAAAAMLPAARLGWCADRPHRGRGDPRRRFARDQHGRLQVGERRARPWRGGRCPVAAYPDRLCARRDRLGGLLRPRPGVRVRRGHSGGADRIRARVLADAADAGRAAFWAHSAVPPWASVAVLSVPTWRARSGTADGPDRAGPRDRDRAAMGVWVRGGDRLCGGVLAAFAGGPLAAGGSPRWGHRAGR